MLTIRSLLNLIIEIQQTTKIRIKFLILFLNKN